MTSALNLDLSAEDKGSRRDTVVQADVYPSAFDSLLLKSCEDPSVLDVLRTEVADREAPNTDVDTLSESLFDLRLDSACFCTIEHFTAHVLASDRRTEGNRNGFTGPLVWVHRIHPRAFHHCITAGFANASDDAERPAYSESDYRHDYNHDYNHDQESKHPSTLPLKGRQMIAVLILAIGAFSFYALVGDSE